MTIMGKVIINKGKEIEELRTFKLQHQQDTERPEGEFNSEYMQN